MFHLPQEIQSKIFSYDPTYYHIWKNVISRFSKCSFCRYDKRIEIDCGHVHLNNGIKTKLTNFLVCSNQCMSLSTIQPNKSFTHMKKFWIKGCLTYQTCEDEYWGETDDEDEDLF